MLAALNVRVVRGAPTRLALSDIDSLNEVTPTIGLGSTLPMAVTYVSAYELLQPVKKCQYLYLPQCLSILP